MNGSIWMLLLISMVLPNTIYGNYLTTPEFAWSIPIVTTTATGNGNTNPDGVVFQKGNAIVPLNDDGLLAITSSTGTLHIVSSNNVVVNNTTGAVVTNTTRITKSYTPNMMGNNLDTTTCQTGIIGAFQSNIAVDNDNVDDDSYVVLYAITGTDSTFQIAPTSRIVAINTTTTVLVWNITIPGTIVGTPVLSSDVLYVVHNVVSTTTSSSFSPVGQVSIFRLGTNSNNLPTPPTLLTTLPSTPIGNRPFGPGSVTTDPTDGRDYFFFAESSDDVFEETFSNSLYAITINDADEFIFLVASNGISSTNTAPTIRINNEEQQLDFFLGQPESKVFGWVGTAAIELFGGLTTVENGSGSDLFPIPSWQIETSQDREDEAAPIPNSPVLSANATILYVTAAGPQILALNLESRELAWSATDLSTTIISKPVYDHQQSTSSSSTNATVTTSPVIYFMETESSILHQYSALDGVSNWVTQCGTVIGDGINRPEDCANVEADFAVVGNMLYYIDIVGNLVATKVADFVVKPPPTSAPKAPPTSTPKAAPVSAPVAKPITAPGNVPTKPTAMPVRPPTSSPTNINLGTTSPTIALITTTPPTTTIDTDAVVSTEEKSIQSWFADNMAIVGASAGALAVLLFVVLLACCVVCRKFRKKNGNQTLGVVGKQVSKTDVTRNDEITVATTPGRSNDKSFETDSNEKSFEVDATAVSPGDPLTSIEEVDDDGDRHTSLDIENSLGQVKEEPAAEEVVTNLTERFAVTSFDMEEEEYDQRVSSNELYSLTRDRSGQSENTMQMDAYSLASKKEVDDAASLTETLSVASKGSARSLKSSILSVLGVPSRTDNDSLRSSKSEKSRQSPKVGQEISTDSVIQRFQPSVSPMPSPRPDYSEPGMILPGQTTSPLLPPGSPTHSLLSNDGSLYMDESTIASLEIPNGERLLFQLQHDALAGTTTVSELPSDCPEDEVTNKLQPGLVYLNRHQAKKERLDQPIRSSLLDDTKRVQPMYNGVSVRPASRSRAGIFSRRQPKANGIDGNIDDTIVTPEVTPEPTVLRTRRTLIAPSSPIVDSAASHHSGSQTPPIRFTAAGYYTEEPEPDDSLLHDNSTVEGQSQISLEADSQTDIANNHVSDKKDTWNSFLSELSKVENQFFNPTAAGKKDKSKRNASKSHNTETSSGRPPIAATLPTPPPDIVDGSESDEEVVPPAPRTFYA